MKYYKYLVKTKNGDSEGGTILAESIEEVQLKLSKEKRFILQIAEEKESRRWWRKGEFSQWSSKEVASFSFQVGLLIQAGISIKQIMSVLAKQNVRTLRYKKIKEEVNRGEALETVLKKNGFPALACTIVAAGRESGLLGEAFLYVHEHYEREGKWKSKMIQALIYPSFVLAFLGIGFIGATIFIFPTFKEVFDSLGVELPYITKLFFIFGEWLLHRKKELVLSVLAFFLVLMGLKENKYIRFFCHKRFWLFGREKVWYGYYFYGRIYGVLSLLLKSGIPLMKALDLVEHLWGNIYAKTLHKEVKLNLAKGCSLGDSLRISGLGTAFVYEMVSLGEMSGTVDEILFRCASYYDSQVEAFMNGIQQVAEPLLLAVVGIFVAILVVAVMLPLFQSISAVAVV